MDEYIAKRVKGAEEDDTALTNDVYFTEEDTVVKVYPKFSLTVLYTMITNIMAFKPSVITREDRMRNEVDVKEEIREAGLNAPEILYQSDNAIEFEMAPGMSGFDYLEDCSGENAERLGQKVGEFLPKLHERGVAIRDFRISNMLVDHGEVYLIDHEYSVLEANRVLKWFDYLTLFSSVRQSSRYKNFKEGFVKETEIGKSALICSLFSSLIHAFFIERSIDRVKRVYDSIKVDLRGSEND